LKEGRKEERKKEGRRERERKEMADKLFACSELNFVFLILAMKITRMLIFEGLFKCLNMLFL
jgi:hypothetical protein